MSTCRHTSQCNQNTFITFVYLYIALLNRHRVAVMLSSWSINMNQRVVTPIPMKSKQNSRVAPSTAETPGKEAGKSSSQGGMACRSFASDEIGNMSRQSEEAKSTAGVYDPLPLARSLEEIKIDERNNIRSADWLRIMYLMSHHR